MNTKFATVALMLVVSTAAHAGCYQNLDDAALKTLSANAIKVANAYAQSKYPLNLGSDPTTADADLKDFLVAQINNDTPMRAQAAKEISWLEQNGRNGNRMGPTYIDMNGEFCSNYIFDAKNTSLKQTTPGNYEVTVAGVDGYHRGFAIKKFVYTLTTELKTENGYSSLYLATYPLLRSQDEVDCDVPFDSSTPAECSQY